MDRSAAWLIAVAALLAAAVLAAVPLDAKPVKATTVAPFTVPSVPGTEQARLQRLLDSTVGPGKAVVLVNATVDRNATASAQLSYVRRGTPVAFSTDTYAGTAGSGRVVDSERAVGTKITVTRGASGATTRKSLALVVDKNVPRSTVRALRTTIANAAGINRRRGDRLAVSRIAFTRTPAAAVGGGLDLATIRYAAGALCGLVFLIALVRALRRAEDERLD
jgi:flagellar M-ring protein FliF